MERTENVEDVEDLVVVEVRQVTQQPGHGALVEAHLVWVSVRGGMWTGGAPRAWRSWRTTP